ncbi:hypothetical protein EV715DRAFT_270053 [Schizophyllum commune]
MEGATHVMWSSEFSASRNLDAQAVEDVRLVRLSREAHATCLTTLEWHWGLKKGELDPRCSENHISLRHDMKRKWREYDWTLIPTPETIREMQRFVVYNARHPEARKSMKEVFPPNHVFEYAFVPLMMSTAPPYPKLRCRVGDDVEQEYAQPYEGLPRVLSRAHPFFIALAAFTHIKKGGTHLTAEERHTIFGPTLDLGHAWLADPPASFVHGVDVWKPHRYPYSDDGSVAFEELHGHRSPHSTSASPETSVRSSWWSNGSTAATSLPSTPSRLPICRRSPRKIRFARDGGLLTIAEKRFLEHMPSPLSMGAWRRTAEGEPLDATANDEELVSYMREPSRDPDAVIRAGMKCAPVPIGIGQGVDTSKCCSNDFAQLLFSTVLASPAKNKPLGHRRLPSSAPVTPRKASESTNRTPRKVMPGTPSRAMVGTPSRAPPGTPSRPTLGTPRKATPARASKPTWR